MLSFLGKGQLIADFSVDTVSGCSPLFVKFSDKSIGNPTSWLWNLGNGNTSTLKNPSTFYFNPGTYTVKLVIRSATGADSIIKTNLITVYQVPSVDFKVSDTTGCYPLKVQFTSLSTPGSGSISSYQWNFGDGTSSTLPNPSHIYNAPGNYSVSLGITNSNGCSRIITKSSLIKIQTGVKASFATMVTPSCKAPVQVTFNNTSVGVGALTYSWNFGDGATSSLMNPTHTYLNNGSYSVQLIVKNLSGCVDTIIKTNAVVVGDNKAIIQSADTVCMNVPVQFKNASTPSAGNSFWDFGDGTFSASANPVKEFYTAGNYFIKLVNTNGTCSDSVIKRITVLTAPVADFTFSLPANSCKFPVPVQFQSQASGVSSYLWDFGDGNTSTLANPVHNYNTGGSFTVSLVVKNSAGCLDTIKKSNALFLGPPKIDSIKGGSFKGCLPYTANLSPVVKTSEPIVSYYWNFGDGTTSTLANPSHTYSSEGFYTISLVVTTASGCSDTIKIPSAIIVHNKPIVNFGATPLISCAREAIQFFDSSSSNVTSWFWDFGEGGTSTQQHPKYHYQDTGFFSVTLTVKNNFCVDSFKRTDYIYILPPIANFEIKFNCDSPFYRRFLDKSIAPQRWEWDFGDGTTSSLQNPDHFYAVPGKYLVKLTVYNQNCHHEATDTVWIIDEHPLLTASDTSVCRFGNILFSATNVNTNNISAYEWDFGDGISVTTTTPFVNYAYKTKGRFYSRVTITDKNGCKRFATFGPVRVVAPDANFGQPPGTCINNEIFFIGKSIADTGYHIVKWKWNFGDGKVDSSQVNTFSHIYTQSGLFDIGLIVWDNKGCSDTLIKPKVVLITDPKAAFFIKDSIRCAGNQVTITNNSLGFGLSYNWSFGDGNISNAKDPVHIYPIEAIYAISLTIKDTFGCTNTLIKPAAVKIGNATAAFSVSDTLELCPPLITQFTNQSVNYSSVAWDFDDGGFSSLTDPSYVFNKPGTYFIKLTAYGFGNCVDSTFKKVVVKGPTGDFTYGPHKICVGSPVNFVANTQNNASFIWDFGDGNTLQTRDSILSHVYANPGMFVPKMVLVDTGGCKVPIIGNDTILVKFVRSIPKTFPTSFCDSGIVNFIDSSFAILDDIVSYQWNFGDGNFSNQQNPIHNYAGYGYFNASLTVVSSFGCRDSAPVVPRIIITPSPQALIGGDTLICINKTASFTAGLAQPNNYIQSWSWDFGNGKKDSVQNPPPQSYVSAGTYPVSVIVTTTAGCADTASLLVKVKNLPEVFAGLDTVICLGQGIQLVTTGTAKNYVWQPHLSLSCTVCPNPWASPTDSMVKYIVQGIDDFGCAKFDTVQVRVLFPFRINAGSRDTLCVGESSQLWAKGTYNYSWSPAAGLNNSTIPNPIASPAITTNYRVIGSDYKGCFYDTSYVPIVVYPRPVFNIIPDTLMLQVGNSVQIKTSSSPDINSWRWIPSSSLSCATCPEPIAFPKTTTTYKAIAKNDGNCPVEDIVQVIVTCTSGNIFIPNTFSPNNDGVNDIFYPRGKGIGRIKSLRIFNRWGTLVFEKNNFNVNDPLSGWDGTYNGLKQGPDVYVYDIQVVCDNNEISYYKGNVTLLN